MGEVGVGGNESDVVWGEGRFEEGVGYVVGMGVVVERERKEVFGIVWVLEVRGERGGEVRGYGRVREVVCERRMSERVLENMSKVIGFWVERVLGYGLIMGKGCGESGRKGLRYEVGLGEKVIGVDEVGWEVEDVRRCGDGIVIGEIVVG